LPLLAMKRVLAFSALLRGVHAFTEDAPPVCRPGHDLADDGSACQMQGDILLQKGKAWKTDPSVPYDPMTDPDSPEAADAYAEMPPDFPMVSTLIGDLGTFTPGAGITVYGRAS